MNGFIYCIYYILDITYETQFLFSLGYAKHVSPQSMMAHLRKTILQEMGLSRNMNSELWTFFPYSASPLHIRPPVDISRLFCFI